MKLLVLCVILAFAGVRAETDEFGAELYVCPRLCYTQWFDRDNPSGYGDFETLLNLRDENPGKICDNPFLIEVQTLAGAAASTTGQVFAYSNTVNGFACLNSQNPKGCLDYRVRFVCPCVKLCYTQWFDRDNPSGNGDYETLQYLRDENPGKICDNPALIEVQTLAGAAASTTGQVFAYSDTVSGFACVNAQNSKVCLDYRVRFACPCENVCFTDWFDRDNPSGNGDYETLQELRNENPGKICDNPVSIEVQTLAGASASTTGQVFAYSDAVVGFVCTNAQNPSGCLDYKVRFGCPC